MCVCVCLYPRGKRGHGKTGGGIPAGEYSVETGYCYHTICSRYLAKRPCAVIHLTRSSCIVDKLSVSAIDLGASDVLGASVQRLHRQLAQNTNPQWLVRVSKAYGGLSPRDLAVKLLEPTEAFLKLNHQIDIRGPKPRHQ